MSARGVAGWTRCLDGEPVRRTYGATDSLGNVWQMDSETGVQSLVSSPSEEAKAAGMGAALAHAARMQAAANDLDALFGISKAVRL